MNHCFANIRIRLTSGLTAGLAFVTVTALTVANEGDWQPNSSWQFQDHVVNSIDHDVQRLASDSYATRQAAARRLIGSGRLATPALQSALTNPSLDMRTQSRLLLRKIHDQQVDRELERLLALEDDGDTIRLPMWEPFRDCIGDDWGARRAYGELVNQYRESVTALSGDTLCGYRLPTVSRLDPRRLDRGDSIGWMLVLFIDLAMDQSPRVIRSTAPMMPSVRMPADRLPMSCVATKTIWERQNFPDQGPRYLSLSARLAMTLTQATSGPVLNHHKTVSQFSGHEELRRLIGAWVGERRTRVNERDRLAIAMRYHCLEQAGELCESILSQPTGDPRSIVMALLSAAALGEANLVVHLDRFKSDRRITHHWQTLGTPGMFVQTQIRDVVLAVRLRQREIDPRSVGFRELTADPTFIYRENSIGFSSNDERDRCYQVANSLLSDR